MKQEIEISKETGQRIVKTVTASAVICALIVTAYQVIKKIFKL